jgi:hypothetical protein
VKKFNGLGIAVITIVVITFTLTHQVLFPVALKGVKAFGHPGACPINLVTFKFYPPWHCH